MTVRHTGIVERIGDECVAVRIVQTSACSECRAKAHCGAAESKEKVVEVFGADGSRLSVGQKVDVIATTGVAMRAVLLAFGWPFLLMIVVLFAVYAYTGNDVAACLAAIGSLVPYYLILYYAREKLREKLTFRIDCST